MRRLGAILDWYEQRIPRARLRAGRDRSRDHRHDPAHLEQDAATAEHARDRFAHGGFGVCEDCSGQIAPERMEALPDATRCIRCQAIWEQTNPR